MTYDDWKTRDDTPEPEPEWYCEACHHYGRDSDPCGCPCCTEPPECDGTEAGLGCDCGRIHKSKPLKLETEKKPTEDEWTAAERRAKRFFAPKRCTYCGHTGHNLRTCPERAKRFR